MAPPPLALVSVSMVTTLLTCRSSLCSNFTKLTQLSIISQKVKIPNGCTGKRASSLFLIRRNCQFVVMSWCLFFSRVSAGGTNSGPFKEIAMEDIPKFPVLPPIGGTVKVADVEKNLIAAKEELAEKLTAYKKMLRHTRSKVRQRQIQRTLYVLPFALLEIIRVVPGTP